jgi:cytoskeletal protein RodZ
VESLGAKLKSTREAKGYSFDQVSKETHITGTYLQALESEEFTVFPGESYLLGFLKTYTDYLGLDVQEVLSLYRSTKVHDQPVPTKQLLKQPFHFPVKAVLSIVLIIVIIVLLAGAIYWYITRPLKQQSIIEVHQAVQWSLVTGFLERRFYPEDSVLISLEPDSYELKLAGIGDALTIISPDGDISLDLNQETNIDLNQDGTDDLSITVTDFAKNDPVTGAFIRFELLGTLSNPEIAVANPTSDTAPTITASMSQTPIFTSANPYPFTVQAVFQNYCLFRWEILSERDRRGRNEQFFQKSNNLNIQQIQNGVRIGVSNATAVRVQVVGGGREQSLDLGVAGEVVIAEIRWVRENDTHYRLVLVRLE